MFYECCREPYLLRNFDQLEIELSKNLYGQPLVLKTVVSAIRGHFELKSPKKALVLSFHGSSGVGSYRAFLFTYSTWYNLFLLHPIGKNFVVNHIIKALYSKGVKSRFFKNWIATKHFTDNGRVNEYKVIKNFLHLLFPRETY